MDSARKIDLVRRQIDEANLGDPADFLPWREQTIATLRVAFGADDYWQQRFSGIQFEPHFILDDPRAVANIQREGVMQAIGLLEGAIVQLEAEGSPEAGLDSAGFHPWVQGAVTGLWDMAPHRMAVDEAARAIEIRLKTLLGVDLIGTPLVTHAFNPAVLKPGERRLRFPGYEEGTQAWTNAHQGAMQFAQGCMMRLRNLAEHHEEFGRDEALEGLAAFSLLARWIESAEIEEG